MSSNGSYSKGGAGCGAVEIDSTANGSLLECVRRGQEDPRGGFQLGLEELKLSYPCFLE